MELQYCINYLGKVPLTGSSVFVALIICLVNELYWSCCFVGSLSDDGDDPSHLINNRGVVDDEDGKS